MANIAIYTQLIPTFALEKLKLFQKQYKSFIKHF